MIDNRSESHCDLFRNDSLKASLQAALQENVELKQQLDAIKVQNGPTNNVVRDAPDNGHANGHERSLSPSSVALSDELNNLNCESRRMLNSVAKC